MKAREPEPDIATALTVEQFCQMFCITPELYGALRRNHLGPHEVRVGDRKVTPRETPQARRGRPLRVFAERWLCHLDLDRLSAFDDARLVLLPCKPIERNWYGPGAQWEKSRLEHSQSGSQCDIAMTLHCNIKLTRYRCLPVSPRDKGISVNLGSVIQFDVIGSAAGDVRDGITSFHPLQGCK